MSGIYVCPWHVCVCVCRISTRACQFCQKKSSVSTGLGGLSTACGRVPLSRSLVAYGFYLCCRQSTAQALCFCGLRACVPIEGLTTKVRWRRLSKSRRAWCLRQRRPPPRPPPVPETPTTGVGEPPAGKSAGLLVGLVQQLQQGGGSAEQLVEALAKLVMDGQVTTDPKSPAEVASTPEASVSVPKAVVPGPTGPPLSMSSVPKAGVPSPPPAPLSSKSAENLAALESLPAVLPAAPPPKAPPLAVVTGISQQIETYNSSTHPKEYKSFRKFCTEDASAKELATAWAYATQFWFTVVVSLDQAFVPQFPNMY